MPQTASLRAATFPPCAGVCASTITSVGAAWREAWFGCGGPFSRALHLRCERPLSSFTLYHDIFNADWTPRERPSWRTRIRWQSTGRRSSRLVDPTFVLFCYYRSRDVSVLDAQHLSGGFHVSTSASSSRPYNMIASYKSFCSLLATFLLQVSCQRKISPSERSYSSHPLPFLYCPTSTPHILPPLNPPPQTCHH